jgi:hypothetical protein
MVRHALAGAITAVLRDLSPDAMVALDPSYAAWSADSTHHHRGFWEVRLAREHAIAAARNTPPPQGFQAGLFDTRAERANQAGHDRNKALADEITQRLIAVKHASLIETKEPRVVLVLVP